MVKVIREIGLNDVQPFAMLFDQYRQFYRQESDMKNVIHFIQQRLQRCDSTILVAEMEQKLVGFTQVYPTFSSINLTSTWLINDLYVQLSARRQGFAKALMETILLKAKDFGIQQVRISTEKTNHQAKQLYKNLGFQLDQRFDYFHLTL